MDDNEAEFSRIASEALAAAGRVRCSKAAYRDGLRQIIDEIEVAQSAVEEELKAEHRANETGEDDR